ncbi:conserved hypothetical protein [Verticillium alfalfae VaMs.102]|uniref:sn-1-specific diacylglycerol lipase n=1 Tax=Verticillium alfalfae (strain VaMs.102 / ATCC MYA-4576 / FGSC 10136) TaxID=526221 RepID=C9SBV1_VERA1|nr:conserved hypothetical protein [Verticillium alfalfae VaMs.102]EEY15835.1 conserved hypothetical protein [Verticillium alfalfae VaMs.102]
MDSGDDPETEKKIVQPSSTGSELVRISSETQPGRTVLPEPVAKAISLATRSSSLALRVGTLITSYGFDAAKFTTLSSLELGRGILEGILHRAGQNAIARSQSTLARVDAETVIERSLESLHMAMSQIVFWTTAGFYVTETTFSAGSQITQLLLSSMDQFFGSTDSSRAIASIITLVRREFQNPATGHSGQKVGVTDLAMGICALAYLQQKCWKLPDEERRRAPQEEIVWDIVVLSDGERVDVHEDSLYGMHKGRYEPKGPGILVSKPGPSPGPDLIATLKRHASQDSGDEDDYLSPENRLRDQIMQSLPADTSVSITTSTHTQKTITVEFTGAESPALSPPPGVELVEREFIPAADARRDVFSSTTGGAVTDQITQRVVYKFDKTMLRSTACRGYDQSPNVPGSVAEIDVLLDGPDNPPPQLPERHKALEEPPPIPPRRRNSKAFEELATSPRSEQTMTPPASDSFHRQTSRKVSDSVLDIVKPQINTLSDNGSNQKRQRAPLGPVGTKRSSEPSPQAEEPLSAKPRLTKSKTEPIKDGKLPPKKTGVRQALKRAPGSSMSSLWSRDTHDATAATAPSTNPAPKPKPASTLKKLVSPTNLPHRPFNRATGPTVSSNLRDKGPFDDHAENPRSSSRAGFISIHERRRDSVVSQTDTYSMHSMDSLRPESPMLARRSPSALGKAFPEYDASEFGSPASPRANRMRQRGHTPSTSLYSIATNGSQTSLVLAARHPKSAYTDSEAIETLRCAGVVDGMFPAKHLLRNITRFMLYSSAAYGSGFLKFMRISRNLPILKAMDETHHEIRSFAHHTGSKAEDVLMASFVDSHGGSDTTGATGTGVPLVHYISLDHESKAVVLACRGTLGFEDVLADLACDYDDMSWRGKSYQVHKGVHASARRLLYGGDGRVLYTLKEALDEFSDYGLILCGHSLGGAVTALLGTMLAEPSPTGTGFVTSAEPHHRLLTYESSATAGSGGTTHVCLPSGRPIHVYAYGPPGTMSPALRKATRGLITSIVHGHDLVPYLSLGVLHDFQAVALAFQSDSTDASRSEARRRVWQASNTDWPTSGEVFVVESSKVLRRDAFVLAEEVDIGRPAKRVVLKYIRDVEARFGEVRFGTSMLMDHSPAKYEEALRKLRLGVVDAGY